jgi:hypothetical protein
VTEPTISTPPDADDLPLAVAILTSWRAELDHVERRVVTLLW